MNWLQFYCLVLTSAVLVAVIKADLAEQAYGLHDIAFDLPDVTQRIATDQGEAQLEAFKALINDRILNLQECRLPERHAQLSWVSIGNPTLRAMPSADNRTLRIFRTDSQGFSVSVEMLNQRQTEVLARAASRKYGVPIAASQIVHLVLSRFECRVRLFWNRERHVIVGWVREFRKFPLRVDFDAPLGTTERAAFDSKIAADERVDLECKLYSHGRELRTNKLTITGRESEALGLTEMLFGTSHTLDKTAYVTRQQLAKLSAEVYSTLRVYEEYSMPEHQFSEQFVAGLVKFTSVAAFRQTPFDDAVRGLSKIGFNIEADLQPDEVRRELSRVWDVRQASNFSYIAVNESVLESYTSSAASASALSALARLLSVDASASFAESRRNEWSQGKLRLSEQLYELNDASKHGVEWEFEGRKLVPKRLNVARLSRANFTKTLVFEHVRRQYYDASFVRSIMLYGYDHMINASQGNDQQVGTGTEAEAQAETAAQLRATIAALNETESRLRSMIRELDERLTRSIESHSRQIAFINESLGSAVLQSSQSPRSPKANLSGILDSISSSSMSFPFAGSTSLCSSNSQRQVNRGELVIFQIETSEYTNGMTCLTSITTSEGSGFAVAVAYYTEANTDKLTIINHVSPRVFSGVGKEYFVIPGQALNLRWETDGSVTREGLVIYITVD